MDPHRTERLTEAIFEELSEIIGYEMSDPRVASAAVTGVFISPDKRHVQVRIGASGDPDMEEVLAALEHAKSFLKRELSSRLDMFRIPELHFEADLAARIGPRLAQIHKRIVKGRPRDAAKTE